MSIFKPDILKGQVAFITGGGTGICKGIAETLAAHGAKLAIASRKLENVEGARKEFEAKGYECLSVVCDVRKPEEVENALTKTLERYGRLDVVVNGAAGNFLCPISQMSYNAFRTVVEIDLLGTYNVTKAAFEAWMRDHGGNIINITATLHYHGTPMQAHVSAAKAGIDSLTRTCAVEWGPMGIRVNSVAPGPIDDTEGVRRLAPGKVKEKAISAVPLGRFGSIQEIADMCAYLCSPSAAYITGAFIVIDGGSWLNASRFQLMAE